ncbi:hypothetical protein EDB81DRAFT_655041 [Dactylonectria macrodidyma]|uniref:NAD-dependent epimerase/dehydratase domain-containing protein n=1 Tax=Dactylonectria macrodidyma TaxID=307937 RepID=A0A9P9J4N4_9HYPO|nr:hypothetical protein EDB81DRAFT_655041 [Dactylonectria macrodidyma]
MGLTILVVGGTGMIGGHAALYLQSKGHQITIAGRHRPDSVPLLAALPFLQGDYVNEDFTKDQLSAFDAVIFTAGADVRHVPADTDADTYLLRANATAVPSFAALARSAGVKQFVHVGSAYPHILPDLIEKDAYIRSRKLAAEGVASLSTPSFSATSLDPPFVVGTVPGLDVPMFQAYVQYAEGKLPIPPSAPQGGLNFISAQSLSEAIAGALEHPSEVASRTILVGDENFTYVEYFDKFFKAVGRENVNVEATAGEHPLLPRSALFAGEEVVTFETNPEDVKILGNFRRNDINRTIEEIVQQYRSK